MHALKDHFRKPSYDGFIFNISPFEREHIIGKYSLRSAGHIYIRNIHV